MAGLTAATITEQRVWAPGLRTIELDRGGIDFSAGQFFSLGLKIDGEVIRRSYSAASAPGAPLQFFLSEVSGGDLTPHLFALETGGQLLVDDKPLGFFTLGEVPECKTLWLVATGTGLGPYVSMLRHGSALDRFERVILVHGVRHEEQLAYREEIEERASKDRRLTYVQALSGSAPTARRRVPGRITSQFESGSLEEAAGQPFDESSHMLLCGNPQMIREMRALLEARGFSKHRRRKPGHFNSEAYW